MNLDRLLAGLGWRPPWRASKFVAYFHLLDACGNPGCPVCRCLRELTFRSLDSLLYEQVNDPNTRHALDQSWGFCAWHASMAREVRNSGLGMAIIYQDLVGQVGAQLHEAYRELNAAPVVPPWRRLLRRTKPLGLVRAWAGRKPCSPCVALGQAEHTYLHTLLDYVEDAEFDRAYARSTGLCLPHIALALAHYPQHRSMAPLLARTLRQLDRLAKVLRGFIDKHDCRKHAPFTADEAESWTNALTFLRGHLELFGNDITRPLTPPPAADAPPPDRAEPQSVEALSERLEAVAVERDRLEVRLRELTRQLGDESSRAAALHYRLWSVDKDRQILELNLAGERASARTWESLVHELRAENAELKARLAKYEPPPPDDAP